MAGACAGQSIANERRPCCEVVGATRDVSLCRLISRTRYSQRKIKMASVVRTFAPSSANPLSGTAPGTRRAIKRTVVQCVQRNANSSEFRKPSR